MATYLFISCYHSILTILLSGARTRGDLLANQVGSRGRGSLVRTAKSLLLCKGDYSGGALSPASISSSFSHPPPSRGCELFSSLLVHVPVLFGGPFSVAPFLSFVFVLVSCLVSVRLHAVRASLLSRCVLLRSLRVVSRSVLLCSCRSCSSCRFRFCGVLACSLAGVALVVVPIWAGVVVVLSRLLFRVLFPSVALCALVCGCVHLRKVPYVVSRKRSVVSRKNTHHGFLRGVGTPSAVSSRPREITEA